MFERDGDLYVPTDAARGPWNRDALHGGAVAALLAGAVEADGEVVVRVLVELFGPVPAEPLRVEVTPAEGGRRVRRQSATLCAGDRRVAAASATRIRRSALDLPEPALRHRIVFGPSAVPPLDRTNPDASAMIGWESFDSLAMTTHWEPTGPGDPALVWLRLLLPIVAGEPTSGTQLAVAAADYGTAGVTGRLPFLDWSYMNADLTVGLSRPPVGDWIGMACTGIVQATGTGIALGEIHDAAGRLGQSAQSLLVEARG